MRISPINFTGIKNTGYCWVNNELNGHKLMKINLNTQLTQEDKKEYRSLIKKYPDYKNKIASDFANIEFQSDFFGLQGRSSVLPPVALRVRASGGPAVAPSG